MKILETLDVLKMGAQLANVSLRVCHALEHFEKAGEYTISTETIRAIMRAAQDEDVFIRAKCSKEYNREDFEAFLKFAEL